MMTRTCTAVLAVAFMNAPALGQYVWDGSSNENWRNGSNWEGNIGWPNGTTHTVVLGTISGSTREEINLRDDTYDVASIHFRSEQYTLRNGALRLHGGINQSTSTAFSTSFIQVFDINIEQVGNGTWSGDEDSQIHLNGVLSGSGQITVTNSSNKRVLRLKVANTYSGTIIINSGYITIRDTNALQNASVQVNNNNGLRFDTVFSSFSIAALAGSANLNIGGNTLTTTGGTNSTFSGNLTGSAGGQFRHSGFSTMTLTGTVSGMDRLRLNGTGELVLDGDESRVTVPELVGDVGEIRIQGGAEVNMDGTGLAWSGTCGTLKVTGEGSLLHNGAELAGATGTGTGHIRVESCGSVSDFDIITLGRLGVGDLIVQLSGKVAAAALGLGGKDDATNGGTGELSVLTGGQVDIAGETRLWTSTSSIAISEGGAMTTGTLTNPNGTSPTIELSDQAANTSLTIGRDSATATTYSGTIVDRDPGSLVKTGANTAILTGSNTYRGGTTIEGGVLLANNLTGSALGTGGATVSSGGTLGGTGTVSGTTTVQSGGSLAPGMSAGTLTVDAVVFNAGSTLASELGGTTPGTGHDQLVVNNTATLGGTLNLSYIASFTASPGDSFVILTAGTLSGTFGGVNYPDAQIWFIAYDPLEGTVTVGVCQCTGCEECVAGACVDDQSECIGCEDCVAGVCEDIQDNCPLAPPLGCQDCVDGDCVDDPLQCTGCEDCVDGVCVDDQSQCIECDICVNGACVDECIGCEDCVTGACVDDRLKCIGCEDCVDGVCVDDQSKCIGCQECVNGACVDNQWKCIGCEDCVDGACVDAQSKCIGCEDCVDRVCIPSSSKCAKCETCNRSGECVKDVPGCCTTDADCDKCETCNPETNTCDKDVAGCCTTDAQCDEGETCDPATNTCTTDAPDAGNNCDDAFLITGGSYMDNDTVVDHVDNYDLDSTAANGDCGSGSPGGQGLGQGPDAVYKLLSPVDCEVSIDADPSDWDLALYVLEGSCNPGEFSNSTCVGLSDAGGNGDPESVTFSAKAGVTYFIIVDGVTNSQGAFGIEVNCIEKPDGNTNIACDPCNLSPDLEVGLEYYRAFAESMAGPGQMPHLPAPECRANFLDDFDFDLDADVDLEDFANLQRVFPGPLS